MSSPFVFGSGEIQTATTDAKGEYRFQGVKEGVFTVRATAKGFVPQTYRPGASVESEFQRINTSSRLRGIDFHLIPEAVIKGVITNVTGEPVEAGVSVTAVQKEKREDGSERLLPISETKTSATGTFILKQLAPGTYFVCVNGPNGYNVLPTDGAWYSEVWYGNVPSVEHSIPVRLREGEERSNIQIAVVRERRHHIVIWPSGPEGGPKPDNYQVSIMHRSHSSMRQPDGSYIIPDIPSGHYTLVTTGWSDSQYVGQADVEFDMADADVILKVTLGGLGEISGILRADNARTDISNGLKVKITSEEGAAQASDVGAEGRFLFTRVLPGRYLFSLLREAPGLKLNIMQCGGTNVTREVPLRIGDREKVNDCVLTVKGGEPRFGESTQ